jgi:hypothetical protein
MEMPGAYEAYDQRKLLLISLLSSQPEFGHIHGIERLPMNLIIGVRSALAAPAACRRAFVAANISGCRLGEVEMVI